MSARLTITLLLAAASLPVHAASIPIALSGSSPVTTHVERAAISSNSEFVNVRVLRDFAETVTLGSDPETGTPRYPHRSVTLTYKVDCDADRLAVSQWQMFAGNRATGEVIWDQRNRKTVGFVPAVNAEMRAVMRSACPTNTVLR